MQDREQERERKLVITKLKPGAEALQENRAQILKAGPSSAYSTVGDPEGEADLALLWRVTHVPIVFPTSEGMLSTQTAPSAVALCEDGFM